MRDLCVCKEELSWWAKNLKERKKNRNWQWKTIKSVFVNQVNSLKIIPMTVREVMAFLKPRSA
jgi:hypothetical protein